jgi:hypothetical protein
MRLPVIALDRRGFVVDVNAAADAVFDNDVKIKDKRLFVHDREARALLKASLDELSNPVKLKPLIAEPIIVQRPDKLPVSPKQDVHALVTLNVLGPKPGLPRRSSPRLSVLPCRRRRSPAS